MPRGPSLTRSHFDGESIRTRFENARVKETSRKK